MKNVIFLSLIQKNIVSIGLSENVKVIDLFCGIGGLTYGLKNTGLNVVAGIDLDETCRYPYEENNKSTFYCKDILNLKGQELNEMFGECKIKILVGCAPCQPFSNYSLKSQDKNKWRLLYEFTRLIKQTKPDIISMENVPRLMKFSKENVFPDFLKNLKKMGYFVEYKIVNCADFGIPQTRKRLVLLASKRGTISLIPNTYQADNYKTVKDAIFKLEPLEHGEASLKDPLHRAAKLKELNLKRVKQSKPGGTWKDWDKELRLECHKKDSGKSYVSVYGRMEWDKPSPTITTHCTGIGNGRFIHPFQNRGITLREAAILQSFPKKYKFIKKGGKLKVKSISTHIGNAVPVKLGEAIGKSILHHIKTFHL